MTTISPAVGYARWAPTFDRTASPIIALEERMLASWTETALKTHRSWRYALGAYAHPAELVRLHEPRLESL